jgi:8-oxo-dGTP pyrophosphatase MutT (NUDIX family)
MRKIYFQHKTLLISNETKNQVTDDFSFIIDSVQETEIILNKALEALGNDHYKTITLITANPDKVLEELKNRFYIIQAAGGLVHTPDDRVLLIYRRGKWDLPKGKLDAGEDLETCAVREVEEETGLQQVILHQLMTTTYHSYLENGKQVLKETYWYDMTVNEQQELVPQTDEDIQECRWIAVDDLASFKTNMQPSVIDVLDDWIHTK